MALHKTSDIILIIFVSISLPVYITFIITVLRNRSKEPFKSAFFTLCVSLGVIDIIMVCHSYFFVKTAGWGWFKDFWLTNGGCGSLLALYGNAMMFAVAVNQHIGVLLLSINRFTAIAFAAHHQRIWSTQNIKIAILLQWICPLVFVLPMSTSNHEYAFYVRNGIVDNDSISINFCDDNYMTAYYLASTFTNLVINVSTCGMYIVVFVKALEQAKKLVNPAIVPSSSSRSISNRSSQRIIPEITLEPPSLEDPPRNSWKSSATSTTIRGQRQRQRRSNEGTALYIAATSSQAIANYQRELRLALGGFLLFLAMFAYFTFLMLILITGDAEFDGGLMYNIVCDIFSCINPYILLLMSRQTRAAFVRTVKCK